MVKIGPKTSYVEFRKTERSTHHQQNHSPEKKFFALPRRKTFHPREILWSPHIINYTNIMVSQGHHSPHYTKIMTTVDGLTRSTHHKVMVQILVLKDWSTQAHIRMKYPTNNSHHSVFKTQEADGLKLWRLLRSISAGASVEVECRDLRHKTGFREEVKTNKYGEFKVHLPFTVSKHIKKIKKSVW